MVVVTFSGVPKVGGRVMGGRVAWILPVTNVSLTSDVSSDDLPTASSPQMQMRTGQYRSQSGLSSGQCGGGGELPVVAMLHVDEDVFVQVHRCRR